MNLPDILNVALGVIILYLLLSSIASLLIELVTGAAHYREEILYVTINRLLAGQPDEPWNISKLVLDRIGRRLPQNWLTGWLRRRWVQKFTPAAPPPETVQRFWAHSKIKVFSESNSSQSARENAFATAILDATNYDESPDFKPQELLQLLHLLQLPAPKPTKSAPKLGEGETAPAAPVMPTEVAKFRARLEALESRVDLHPHATVAKYAEAALKTIEDDDNHPIDPGHPLGLLRALAPKGNRLSSAQTMVDGSPDVVQRFWNHPKIRSLAAPGMESPPSMEAMTFASVVIDITIPRDAQGVLPDNRLALLRALKAPSTDTPAALLNTLRTLGLSSQIAVGATGEALWKPFRANVAAWFEEASAGASSVYRRTMQRLLLGLGLLLALVLNADTVRTIHLLSHDRPLREAMAAYSETLAAEHSARMDAAQAKAVTAPAASSAPSTPTPIAATTPAAPATPPVATSAPVAPTAPTPAAAATTTPATTTAAPAAAQIQVRELSATRVALGEDIERLRELEQMGFPIGWSGRDRGFHNAEALVAWAGESNDWPTLAIASAIFVMIVLKLVGLGATALAISQGAPFWYDLMNRVIGLRKGQTAPTNADPKNQSSGANGGALSDTSTVTASALPLEIGHDLASPATGFDARKAYWLARASAAAYSPRQEIEALVRGSWKFHEFHFFDKEGTQAFCASDDQIVLIAFRGTELQETTDILDDVKFGLMESDVYGKAPLRQVHRGFHGSLGRVWDDLSVKIDEWTKPVKGRAARQIFITGHSLGGALGTLMFARLALAADRPVPTLYTFGCPKVGDKNFSAQLDQRYPERLFRVVNDSDIVPHLPPPQVAAALPEYFHAGHEYTFDKDGKLRSEISGLSRVLGYAAKVAAKSVKEATRQAVDDHGMAYYVAKCKALAEKA
jgi:triacylglycerol lipase